MFKLEGNLGNDQQRVSNLRPNIARSDWAGAYGEGLAGFLKPEEPGTMVGTLDGVAVTNGAVELTAGAHTIETAANCQPAVVWVGPHLDRLHRLGAGDRARLFKNRY